MIRVLHVLDELRSSGVERRILAAADRWRAEGIATTVLATGQAVGPYAPVFSAAGIEVHHVPYRPRPGYLRDLVAVVRRADIVQFHTERAFIYSELACRAAGRRVVHSPCSDLHLGGTWRLRRTVQRWLARRAGVRMIATSDSIQANEWERFRNRSMLIRNYVDTSRFVAGDRAAARARLGIAPNALVLCSLGNCSVAKNHVAMWEAVAMWGSGRRDWTFLHAGDDSRSGERELVVRLGIADRCRFLGSVEEPERVLQAADVFVMTSFEEGLGNAALEAAACGLVLVLTDVNGLRDLKGTAQLVRWVGTGADQIAPGITWATAMARSVDAGRRAAQHASVATRFGLDRGAAEYAALYRDLMEPRRGR